MLHRRRYRAAGSQPEFSSTSVFITPMLDMSFQILAFFVVTFNPPALEGRLPWESAAGKQGGPNPVVNSTTAQPTTKTELPPPITVEALADRAGRLDGILIRVEGEQEPRAPLRNKAPDKLVADLQDELLKLKRNFPAEKRITVVLPYHLLWDFSITIMDACRSYRNANGRESELFPRIESDLRQ